ncbi:MAG: glycerate kinase [Actinomycetia bacterium]|nr:glycerate kinase [Actinomycetes bacterium]
MKIVVASDKYKGSLSALEVCSIIERTIKELDPEVIVEICPMADGGEGTAGTLVESLNGKMIELDVTGPLGEKVRAELGMLDDGTAIIEMASASGYVLVPGDRRNPMETTTFGTGELIKKALELGSKKIIIGIGGSATNDGGMGMAQALGYEFIGSGGELLGFGGKELRKLKKIKTAGIHSALASASIEVACDVDNPLFGKRGAAYVYGPQKGADPGMVAELDAGLKNFAEVVASDLGKDISRLPGAGAAGGLGAGLAAFTGASLRPGTDIIIEVTGLERKIRDADLVITGEGAMDEQTFYGKSPFGVAKLASKYDIPTITINGSVLAEREKINKKDLLLFSGNFSIIDRPMKLEEAISQAPELLAGITMEIIGFYLKILKKK